MSNTLCPQISQWMLFASELRSTYIAVITANVICSCVAMLGNAIMVAAILRNSSLRCTPSFMLLCTLAISDLGVGIICQPLFITLRVTETLDDKELSCKIGIAYSSTVGCLVILSFLTITAISFDRFLAVLLKLNYRGVVTVKRVKVVVSLLWLASVLSGMTYVLHIPTYFYLVMVVLSTCLIFAAFNYLAIAWKLYGQSARLQLHRTSLDGEKQSKSFNLGQYKKTLKSMLYIYIAFLLCYLPFLCFTIALKSIGRTSTVHAVYLVAATLGLASSAVNPCLYYWRITELREAVQKLLGFNQDVIQDATPGMSKTENRL